MRRRSSSRDHREELDISKPRNAPLDPINEGSKETFSSPPAHRTRNAAKQVSEAVGDASEFGRPGTNSKEAVQNIQNYRYEYESNTSTQIVTNNGHSPVSIGNISESFRLDQCSPSDSDKSNESFAESVLADYTRMPADDVNHLPYRLYKLAGEYWNKYPKTDYTYSRFSKDRVELAPGQIAVPNMSRLSLNNHRLGGSYSSSSSLNEEYFSKASAAETQNLRYRYGNDTYKSYGNLSDSDLDEADTRRYKPYSQIKINERWWITRTVIAIWTFISTSITSVFSKIFRRNSAANRYPSYRSGNFYNTYITKTTTTTTTEMIEESKIKKWWPLLLLLLLLLPLAYWLWVQQDNTQQVIVEENPNVVITDDVINKIALLVKESMKVEPPPPQIIERIIEEKNVFDLSILDKQKELIDKLQTEVEDLKIQLKDSKDIDDKVKSISYKQSKDMLVQFFNLHSAYGDKPTDEDIKTFFSNSSLSREELEDRLADMRRALLIDLEDVGESVKTDIKLLKESVLSSAAKAASATVISDSGCKCDESVMIGLIGRAISIYDADKTGKTDYALESAGGQIISTRCTEKYDVKTALITISPFGIPIPWGYHTITPRKIITPGTVPGDCWAFKGFPGRLVIKLSARIYVTGFTMEHIPASLTIYKRIDSAPQNFTVLGLQNEEDLEPVKFGDYQYRNDSTPMQYFPTDADLSLHNDPIGFQFVELQVESNHGNLNYTCLYRFRVHGDPVSGIR